MVALAGRALGVEPSEMLLQVLDITGHNDAASVSLAFVKALQLWDRAGGAPRTFEDVASADLRPLHDIGVPTNDVLLYLASVRKEVKSLWSGAPAAEAVPTLLFGFFGFFDPRYVSSLKQLTKKAVNMIGERGLGALGDDVDARRMYLHGPCFEAPPVLRRSSTSSRDSTGSEDRRETDRLADERRWHQREVIRLEARKAELDAARDETTRQTAALSMQRQHQTLAESRLLAAEAQLKKREARCAVEEVSAVQARSDAMRLEELYRKAVDQATAADARRKQLTTLRRADQAAVVACSASSPGRSALKSRTRNVY
jgi:hypothetical protein